MYSYLIKSTFRFFQKVFYFRTFHSLLLQTTIIINNNNRSNVRRCMRWQFYITIKCAEWIKGKGCRPYNNSLECSGRAILTPLTSDLIFYTYTMSLKFTSKYDMEQHLKIESYYRHQFTRNLQCRITGRMHYKMQWIGQRLYI